MVPKRMGIVDLHSHSHYSDGALHPAELVRQAARAGVAVLALTDHDSVAGLDEACREAAVCGIELVPGVELSARWRTTPVHVLGLGLDPDAPALVAGLALQAEARAVRARAIGTKLEALGIAGAFAGACARAGGDPSRVGRLHIAEWLVSVGAVRTLQGAFDAYLGDGRRADVPIPWLAMSAAIALIHGAGGVAVLAHPGRYHLARRDVRALVTEFARDGGEAIEVASGRERLDVVQFLAALAMELGLEASQGSDFHGPSVPWYTLGSFPKLPPGPAALATRFVR